MGAQHDPFGVEAEAIAEAGGGSTSAAARRARRWSSRSARSWRRSTTGGGPRLSRLVVPLVFAVPVAAVVPAASTSASAPRQANAHAAVIAPQAAVPVTGGPSAFYGKYWVQHASTSGAIVTPESITAFGQGSPATTAIYFLPAGKKALVSYTPKYPAGYTNYDGASAINGAMLIGIGQNATTSALWWYDLAVKKSGSYIVPAGYYFFSAAPTGAILATATSPTTYKYVNFLKANAVTTLATLTVTGEAIAGPGGILVPDSSGSQYRLQYVSYTPAAPKTLDAGSWSCLSVTTNAAACELYSNSVETPERVALPSGKLQKLTGTFQNLLVTPKATGLVNCSGPSCTLTIIPATTKPKTVTVKLAPFTNLAYGMWAIGDTFVWGQAINASSTGGLFEMADTSTKPVLTVSAPRTPGAAGVVAITGNTVGWEDNTKPGLAYWSRSVSGTTKITLGAPVLLGSANFAVTDATGTSLDLALSGTESAYSAYQPGGTTMGIYVHSGASTVLATTSVPYYLSNFQLSGNYLLYENTSGQWVLDDWATKRATTLPSTDSAVAIGGNALAWVNSNGSVEEEVLGSSTPKTLATPPKGATVYYGERPSIAVDGTGMVAWAYTYCTTNTCAKREPVASYFDTLISSTKTESLPHPAAGMSGLSVAPVGKVGFIGFVLSAGGNPPGSAYLVNLQKPTTASRIATNVKSFAVSSTYAVYLSGANNIPYVVYI